MCTPADLHYQFVIVSRDWDFKIDTTMVVPKKVLTYRVEMSSLKRRAAPDEQKIGHTL
jgi:hypothetical protein